ncbi:tryptophan synthase subunit alpha [Serpentinicella alkaliphila]|uniref:Tryptophan synthase alpha chain n=1 Tax=Serpentinicella alkaliphila TaxID=1734049 RepID=A0A4R2TTK6_9FIRM|nr:tryptophan synthase subunit alpha [Serpentinicella alkaliphila]QUH25298.1 tryptophan synthase subunit alpha [Serpentinicella alkaliphila]TCQ07111.1 tryptophan synthase alpha chain [Serpentinicella alkaliphila]
MNIIENTFKKLKSLNKVAFIPFIVAGHPTLEKTEELILLLEHEGADIIEIGIPFSDPLADGPVIESAAQKSILNSTKVNQVFNSILNLRKKTNIPIVILVYFNTILASGASGFIEKCLKANVNGLIIPDLPYEERDELLSLIKETDISLIPLVTPTSNNRIEKIVSDCKGFVYCVSSLGVTGIRKDFNKDLSSFLNSVRQYTDLPLALGFGISNKATIDELKTHVDGIIVGSALVNKIEESNCNLEEIKEFIKDMVSPLKN